MTIDEAIKHCEEVAGIKEKEGSLNQESFMPLNDFMKYRVECLKCASEHRQLAEWLRELKRDREILDGLSIYFQSLVVDAVINQRPLKFDMRDATEKERESVKRYIADSVVTTGVNLLSIIGEVNADEDSD